jgi:hypothetical protein
MRQADISSRRSARRRRLRGLNPRYGTGWTGRTPFGHGQPQYNPNYGYQQQQPYNVGTRNETQGTEGYGGYYAGGYVSSNTTGTGHGAYWPSQQGPPPPSYEMQPPSQSYGNTQRRADDVGYVYQAPAGPPPKKN